VYWSDSGGVLVRGRLLQDVSEGESEQHMLLRVVHNKPVVQVTWHYKGDYFATLAPAANTKAVLIHQLSKLQSQNPFTKSKADAQKILFHPSKPFLFVATKKHIKVYNLQKQELAKNLVGGFKWLSSFDVHPGGDNVCCSAYDRRLTWFDMDLSAKPYKTMRYNNTGLKSVSIHKRLPLFATGGEDGMVYVFHGMVYNDLMDNPLIVPLKRIHAHTCDGTDGVMDRVFHPTQPWLLTCGVDQTIRLFVET
jgi:ribosome biogenesis protein ERB1